MKLKKAIGKIFPVLDSDKRKKTVVRSVLAKNQTNKGVVNIHRHDKNNIGDYFCAPHLYFEQLQNTALDISDFRLKNKSKVANWIDKVSDNSLIIGGGGLLNIRYFEMQLNLFQELNNKGKKTVIWGAGHNAIDYKNFNLNPKYNVDITKYGLVGTRDYNMPNEWVPCVSCLHPIFDQKFTEDKEIGVLLGKKSTKNKILLNKISSYPNTSNMSSLEEMVNFIGSTNTLVTDSYHAMYWAMLLNKKVIVVPTTSKFFDFKYQPVISSFENFENDLNKAQSYSGILEECREVNLKFADKVFDYLNL